MNTPILFLIFNRPNETRKVFETIRAAKPKKLFIAADGPRVTKPEENKLCEETRSIVSRIDWPCEVVTLFREANLGCKIAVSGAIDWFFEHVEEGIILEDDCLPEQSFFLFCEELLEKYRDDGKIMHISGDNFQFGKVRGNGDYYFSKMTHVWGWATWKRAWKNYDIKMTSLQQFIENNLINEIFDDRDIAKKWIDIFIKSQKNEIDSWDYQWTYTVWSQNGLAILPNKNLVKNIGFGIEATHTTTPSSIIEKNATSSLLIKKHPSVVERNYEADIYYHKIMEIGILKRFINKIFSTLR